MPEKVTVLRQIDIDTNAFDACGVKFIIHPSLPIGPYKHYQRLQVVIGFGGDYPAIYKTAEKAYTQINTMKVADAAVTLNGLLEGVGRKKQNLPDPFLLLCSLFIRREGANLAEWSEAEAAEDIELWEKAGYDIAAFFLLAKRLSRGFANGLQADSPNTSQTTAKPKKAARTEA
jgi:hypothetical protein